MNSKNSNEITAIINESLDALRNVLATSIADQQNQATWPQLDRPVVDGQHNLLHVS